MATGAAPAPGQGAAPDAKEKTAKLIAVLKSDASQHDKMEACRQLARVGTLEAVPVLAALLSDEQLAHMARYGLEPIQDPAVDVTFREALGKLKGKLLVGVIGSIGVRRDTKAVAALAKLLENDNPQVAQAAARSLGAIGNTEAVQALDGALADKRAGMQLAVCEGLFRCAEALAAKDQREAAVQIYDRLRELKTAPHQVRAGALRGAILARGKAGLPLLKEFLRGKDYILFAAAVRTAQELPLDEVSQMLIAELGNLPSDRQILVIQTLRGKLDASVLPTLLAAAKTDIPLDQRLGMCRLAAARVKTADEKGQLLAILATIPSPDALPLVVVHLEDKATKESAVKAAVAVAEKILKSPDAANSAARLIEPLQKVAQNSTDPELTARVQALLKQAQSASKAGKKK
jgi:hypothetical protein